MFRDGDFSGTVRWELYVPSSIALIGEVRPSMRSYSAELKLILSLSIDAVGGMSMDIEQCSKGPQNLGIRIVNPEDMLARGGFQEKMKLQSFYFKSYPKPAPGRY